METEIWRDFDLNLDIPVELKNARYAVPADSEEIPDPDADIDIQDETLIDDDSQIDEDEIGNELGVPASLYIVSQTVHTAPDGRLVVDVVIEVEEVEDAVDYEVRITKA